MSDSKKERIEWVDIAKFICIIAVIATHSIYCDDIFTIFFSPFFLSLFFFLSGYVYNKKYTFKDVLIKKIKTILIPWFVFGIFNLIAKQIITFNEQTSFITDLKYMFLQIRGIGDIQWFLICLFVSFIPFYFIINKLNKNKSIIISLVLAILNILYVKYIKLNIMGFATNSLPWHLQTIFVATFFMVIGFYYKNEYEKKIKISNKTLIILNVIYIFGVVSIYISSKAIIGINAYNVPIFIWFVVVLMSILIQIEISKKIKNNKIISYIGSNTIIIFCLHGKIQSLVEKLFRIVKLDEVFKLNILTNFIGTTLSCIIIIIALFIPIFIINKYLPFVVGRKYQIENKGEKNGRKKA